MMEIQYIVRAAREFLVRNGTVAGEALIMDVGPDLQVSAEEQERLPFGESYRPCFVGFCELPVVDPFNPRLFVCQAMRDLSIEPCIDNPIPIRVDWHDAKLVVPRGKRSLLEIIEICRTLAACRNLPLGEHLNQKIAQGVWQVHFERGDAPHPRDGTMENSCCLFEVDDLTGEVTGLCERF